MTAMALIVPRPTDMRVDLMRNLAGQCSEPAEGRARQGRKERGVPDRETLAGACIPEPASTRATEDAAFAKSVGRLSLLGAGMRTTRVRPWRAGRAPPAVPRWTRPRPPRASRSA